MRIFNATEDVLLALVNHPVLRDDDRRLVAHVLQKQARGKYGDDLRTVSAKAFLDDYAAGSFSSVESIRRTRQALQTKVPELRGYRYDERKGRQEEEVRIDVRSGPVTDRYRPGLVKSCDKACGPGDYYPGGKCDRNGCYDGPREEGQ